MGRTGDMRIEHDLVGDRGVPASANYGIHGLSVLFAVDVIQGGAGNVGSELELHRYQLAQLTGALSI